MEIVITGPPFELITQQLPTAFASGEIVELTLPVFAAGFPQATQELQVRMTIEHAEQLWAQRQPALMLARTSRKVGW